MPLLEPYMAALVTVLGASVVHGLLASAVSAHVLLHKESSRAATGWIGLVWLSPFIGSLAYLLLGFNRVKRKAVKLRRLVTSRETTPRRHAVEVLQRAGLDALIPLERAVGEVTGAPLLEGSDVTVLRGGEQTYPAMLRAIDDAQHSVGLMTFIFDGDELGERFVEALARAKARGVEVRVLIDGVGAWFSWPSAVASLRRAGVPYDRFLWSWNPFRMALLNLRNHRKVLVVDGREAFTGGMNVRGSFVEEGDGPRQAEDDLHVRVRGPLVASLVDLFATDWAFETGETLSGEVWYPSLDAVGALAGRVVPDGPDEDHDKAATVLLDAVSCARERLIVVTPYFLPEDGLRDALCAAARRGVVVDIVVPWPSNHAAVDRAMRADLTKLLSAGVRVWGQPAPFDHSKLMVVDGRWSCVGSANWDPRSLRLNFEMLLEVYGDPLAAPLECLAMEKRDRSVAFELASLAQRSTSSRLVDRLFWLFKPYL